MKLNTVFPKAWRLAWNLRALWAFGFVLAMTTGSSAFWLWRANGENIPSGITIRVSPDRDWIKIFGEGLKIDLTTPGGPTAWLRDAGRWIEIRELGRELGEITPVDLGTILIFAAAELALLWILAVVARYVSEAAAIRTVTVYEETGEKTSFRRSFRLGWSRIAWRLFGIDLAVKLVVGLGLALLFAAAMSPLFLLALESTPAGILAAFLTVLLLIPGLFLAAVAIPASSLVIQVSWRACALEGLGVRASLRQGLFAARKSFPEVGLTWLIWWLTGMLWIPASVIVTLILSPLALVMLLAGALLGFGPALLTWGLSSLFTQGITPWVLGALVGLPILIPALLAPLFLVGGWVRLFQSNLWTLACRALPTLKPLPLAARPVSEAPQVRPASAG